MGPSQATDTSTSACSRLSITNVLFLLFVQHTWVLPECRSITGHRHLYLCLFQAVNHQCLFLLFVQHTWVSPERGSITGHQHLGSWSAADLRHQAAAGQGHHPCRDDQEGRYRILTANFECRCFLYRLVCGGSVWLHSRGCWKRLPMPSFCCKHITFVK